MFTHDHTAELKTRKKMELEVICGGRKARSKIETKFTICKLILQAI